MIRVLTVGVFDLLHIGHVLLFQHIKELYGKNCCLTVAVQDGDYIHKYKPEAKMVYNTEERIYMVKSVRYVDDVVVYKDVDKDIQNLEFDVFVKGPDQNHEGFRRAEEWCMHHGKEVATIQRTGGISSTMIAKFTVESR